MVSVIIAAHDEEAVVGACIDALRAQHTLRPLEIVVSANGCSDRTVAIARARGTTVVDRPEPGKPGALNAGERVATSFPRLYLDADIIVPPGAVEQLIAVLEASEGILAAAPRRRISTVGRPLLVRAYFAINERLPVFRNGLFGRGLIALSETGRARFGEFPSLVADDLFVDSVFSAAEKVVTSDVEIVVEAPFSTRDLLARLVRVRRGNAEMRSARRSLDQTDAVRPSDRWAWLRDVVATEPRLAPAAVPYVAITLLAGLLARRPARGWGRDDSSRARRAGAGAAEGAA